MLTIFTFYDRRFARSFVTFYGMFLNNSWTLLSHPASWYVALCALARLPLPPRWSTLDCAGGNASAYIRRYVWALRTQTSTHIDMKRSAPNNRDNVCICVCVYLRALIQILFKRYVHISDDFVIIYYRACLMFFVVLFCHPNAQMKIKHCARFCSFYTYCTTTAPPSWP